MDVARMGYENGSSNIFSPTEGTMSHGLGLSVSSWYEGNETFYLPERRFLNNDILKGQAHEYTNQGHMNNTTGSIVNAAVYSAGVRLSDTHLASRKAEEAGSDLRLFSS
jgi:hypothetical protein